MQSNVVRLVHSEHPEASSPLDLLSEGLTAHRQETLTEKNWRLYLARCYDNPQACGEEEFFQDLKRFKYLKKAISRYEKTGELNGRRILNHIIILCNMFGPVAVVRVVFLKMEEHLRSLKPFLIALSILPETVYSVGKADRHFKTDMIGMDPKVIAALRREL
jgi:hypothetical protein